MDAITALATITQLLGLFIQEKRGEEDLQKQQFIDWLECHRHEELKELICNSRHLSEQVDTILRTSQALILSEIHAVNGTLAQIMSRLQALGTLSKILTPEITLSDFAVAALCHFVDSRAVHLLTLPDGSGVQFDNSGGIQHEDPRFLSDDMDALEACGFIRVEAHHRSYSVYRLTRQGAAYAQTVKTECKQLAESNDFPPGVQPVS